MSNHYKKKNIVFLVFFLVAVFFGFWGRISDARPKQFQKHVFETNDYQLILDAPKFSQGNLLYLRIFSPKSGTKVLSVRAENGQMTLTKCLASEVQDFIKTKHSQSNKYSSLDDKEKLCEYAFWAYPPEGKTGKKKIFVLVQLSNGQTVEHEHSFFWAQTKYPRIVGDVRRLQRITKFPSQAVENQYKAHERLKKQIVSRITPRKWQGSFIAPLKGPIYGKFYLRRWYGKKLGSAHTGIDYIVPRGRQIKAINSGRVALVIHHYYHGNTTIIDHGEGLFSFYLHQHQVFVKPGEFIAKGKVIGTVGNTGSVSSTTHLHLGITFCGLDVDPLSLLAF